MTKSIVRILCKRLIMAYNTPAISELKTATILTLPEIRALIFQELCERPPFPMLLVYLEIRERPGYIDRQSICRKHRRTMIDYPPDMQDIAKRNHTYLLTSRYF